MNYFTDKTRRGTRTMHHRHFHYSEHDRGGPHHGRRGGGGRHRAKRGAVAASILTLLSERPMNGYELITELETRSEGRWRPSPGAIYPALRKLEDRGSITSTEVGGKLQFELTDRGRTMLAYYVEEQGDDAAPPWSEVPSSDRSGDMRALVFEMVGQARRIRRVGTTEQIEQARAIIAEATTKLAALTAPADRSPESDEPTTD